MRKTILKNRPRGFRATAVVIHNNKLLLMKQIYKGEEFYNLPGGSVENGEVIEEACAREVQEEFNIEVAVGRLIYLLDSPHRLNYVFECTYISGELSLGGPEGQRMSKHDQYYVEWVDLSSIKDINLKPQSTKDAMIKYLSDQNAPTFFLSTYKEINKNILIIAPELYMVPPDGYGGIERIATMAYLNYINNGYTVDIMSKPGSGLHTFSSKDIENIDFKKYSFIVCYRYEEELLKFVDDQGILTHVILENKCSDKYHFITGLRNCIFYSVSKDQQTEFNNKIGESFDIIPNGIDWHYFTNDSLQREKDIVFIGAIGQHKSPLASLQFAQKHDLFIDFYGPILFIDSEKEYSDKFFETLKQYPKAKLLPETTSDKQKKNILNQYKYFIFLPSIDKREWVEPCALAPIEAMACGCTVVTQFEIGGHLSYCNKENSISYLDEPKLIDSNLIRSSVKNFDFRVIFNKYYPK